MREPEADRRRPARAAVDVEVAPEEAHTLAHPDQAEPSALGRADQCLRDLEAPAVIDDLRFGAAHASVHPDPYFVRAAVLADVGETLLDDSIERDPLRRGHRIQVAAHLERDAHVRSGREAVNLALKDVGQRAVEHAGRLERLGQLPQGTVEFDDLGVEVFEAPGDNRARPPVDVLGDLGVRQPDVTGKCDEILDRPVVKVVAEAQEAPLAGLDEGALALCVALQEHVALQHRREQRRRFLEEGKRARPAIGTGADDECCVRLLPALDGDAVDPAALVDAAVGNSLERGSRDVADAAGRLRLADMDEAAGLAERAARPEGDVRNRREREQEAELELDRRQRRELEEPRVRRGAQEEIERCGLCRAADCRCNGRDHLADRILRQGPLELQTRESVGRVGERRGTKGLVAATGSLRESTCPHAGGRERRGRVRMAVEAGEIGLELVE